MKLWKKPGILSGWQRNFLIITLRIKGVESVASAIWMTRTGKSKEEIKQYITEEFEYDLNMICDEIRPD